MTAGEILDSQSLSNDKKAVVLVLTNLRTIGKRMLETEESIPIRTLKRILRLFHKASTSPSPVTRQVLNVPTELLQLVEHKVEQQQTHNDSDSLSSDSRQKVLELIGFLSEEAMPFDILQTFVLMTKSFNPEQETFSFLHGILVRGVLLSLNTELSGTLLRLKRARMEQTKKQTNCSETEIVSSDVDLHNDGYPTESIWKQMSNGMVEVDK